MSGIRLLAPPPDTPAPLNLAYVVVAAADPALLAEPTLSGPYGAVEIDARAPPPEDPMCLGWEQGACLVLALAEPLEPDADHVITMAGGAVRFHTGADYDLVAPAPPVGVAVSDGCLVARTGGGEPTWAALYAEDLSAGAGLAPAHELAIRGAPAGTPSLFLLDLAGNGASIDLPPVEGAGRASIVITEVLANPAGPEPEQEWVEIMNVGDGPAALGGVRVADASGSDPLPQATLDKGARALIVASGYDPAAPGDVPPAPGTLILRLEGTTIGHNGLANTGETVSLLGADGALLSVFTSYYDASGSSWQGRSVERIRPGGCDVADNVSPNVNHAATPGARNSVE